MQPPQKNNPDLNTALDSDRLAQCGHCDYLEVKKRRSKKQKK